MLNVGQDESSLDMEEGEWDYPNQTLTSATRWGFPTLRNGVVDRSQLAVTRKFLNRQFLQ